MSMVTIHQPTTGIFESPSTPSSCCSAVAG